MANPTISTRDVAAETPDRGVPTLVWGRSKDGRHHRLEVPANLGGTPGFTLCGRFAETPPIHGEPGIGCVGCWQRERDQLYARIDQLTAELRAVRTENVPGVGA